MALPDLNTLYDEYNTKYFRGRLPKIPVVWEDPSSEDHAAEFWSDPEMKIVIATFVRDLGMGRYLGILLLHEMVHVKLRDRRIADHGRLFHTEMKRLARIGAFVRLW